MSEAGAPVAKGGRPASVWLLFAVLTVLWGGAYALTRVAVGKDAVEGLPPEWVLPGRLTTGALVLWGLVLASGQRMPSFSERRSWAFIGAMGFAGSLLPFFLITTAQETVNSSLAALYTAAAPVFVVLGATMLFVEERMTRNTGIGVLLGFAGIVVLFGPEAIADFGSASVTAQMLLLVATLSYSASTLIARAAPPIPPIAFAAGFASVGAVLSWPLALRIDPASVEAGWEHWLAVAALGLGPSGIGQAIFMAIVARAGATFLSLTGYSVPVAGAVFGWVFFEELQSWNALVAFVLILGGVWMARAGGSGRAGR